jgi:solute carrier family 25 aspartate/glutamate transporter 12/13
LVFCSVKIRLQLQGMNDKVSAVSVVQNMGIRGLYRGFASTLLRDIPFNAVYFTAYNVLKSVQSERKIAQGKKGQLTAAELLTVGCISGTMASGITTPADCIKTCIVRLIQFSLRS